jgi:hypothetical protein
VFFATIAFTICFPSVVLWLPKQVLPASVGCFRSPSGVGYLSAVSVMFGIADQQAWHGRDHRDWREVSDQIERQFRIERCVDRVAGEADRQRIAVRRRSCDRFRSNAAASTGPVLDQKRWPNKLDSACAIVLAMVSVIPPANAPTKSLIGLEE